MNAEIEQILNDVELPELAGSGDAIQIGLMIGVGVDIFIGK